MTKHRKSNAIITNTEAFIARPKPSMMTFIRGINDMNRMRRTIRPSLNIFKKEVCGGTGIKNAKSDGKLTKTIKKSKAIA